MGKVFFFFFFFLIYFAHAVSLLAETVPGACEGPGMLAPERMSSTPHTAVPSSPPPPRAKLRVFSPRNTQPCFDICCPFF